MQNSMQRYSNKQVTWKRLLAKAAGLAAIILITFSIFVSCVDKDTTVGGSFIPDDQFMAMRIDSSFVIKTYNITTDSIEASGFRDIHLGGMHYDQAGTVNASIIFQMTAPTFSDADVKFGLNAVIDSVFFVIAATDSVGNYGVSQTFEMYELTSPVYIDSLYYSDFDPTPIVAPAPMFTFVNEMDENGNMITKFDDQNFFNMLLDTTGYSVDSIFRERFNGFYVTPAVPHNDASVYQINLGLSYLYVHYHNFNEEPDTSAVLYHFRPATVAGGGISQSIGMVDYDFSGADPALRIDDLSQPVEKTFVQGFGGLATSLEFAKESVDQIKAKVRAEGYKSIVVNKAKLEIMYPERDNVVVDQSFTRLGMYLDYRSEEGIPDYSYLNELYGGKLNYGGYINKSRYLYQMDISEYVQRLFREDYTGEWSVILASSVDEIQTMAYVGLDGYGSANPLRLVLTYTMIR